MDLSRLVLSVELFYLLCLCYFCTFVAFGEEHSHTVTTRERWEVYAIKELISGKDEFLTCPTREYRLQDPDTISFLDRKRDDSKVTSVLEMVSTYNVQFSRSPGTSGVQVGTSGM